jgi:hypothetical protein
MPAAFFTLVSCLASSSAWKMEATYSSQMSVDFQWIKQRYITEYRTVHSQPLRQSKILLSCFASYMKTFIHLCVFYQIYWPNFLLAYVNSEKRVIGKGEINPSLTHFAHVNMHGTVADAKE